MRHMENQCSKFRLCTFAYLFIFIFQSEGFEEDLLEASMFFLLLINCSTYHPILITFMAYDFFRDKMFERNM